MTDSELISNIRSVREPLRRFLLALCEGDAFTADDIAQDTLTKIWISADTYRVDRNFTAWVFKTAYNSWLNGRYTQRHSSLEEMSLDVSDNGSSEDSMVRNVDGHQELYRAIEGLNAKEKAAVLLFYMEDRNIREIAVILGVRDGTVKSLLSRGREDIKRFMTKQND